MEKSFSLSSSSEFVHGDTFSVYVDDLDSYWVVSNSFPSVFKGPNDRRTALKLVDCANDVVNYLNSKGLYYL